MATWERYRIRYLCPVCHRTVGLVAYPDAIECEDDDGWIVYYHKRCWDDELEKPE